MRRLRRATEVDDGRAVVREISSDVEIMSNRSSSTYVDFNESPPPIAKARIGPELPKRSHRRASSLALNFEGPRSCSILQPLSPLSPIRKLDTGPYVGFSFNPLFFGQTEFTSSEATKNSTH